MQQADKTHCKQFEIEVWLYISGELDEKRKHSWDSHLEICKECRELLNSNVETSSFYKENLEDDISDIVFDKMIENITVKSSFLDKVKLYLKKLNNSFSFGKVVVGSTLITASLIIIFLAQRPNPVKEEVKVAAVKYKWDDSDFKNQVKDVSNALIILENKSKKADIEWDKSVSGIENMIDSLKTRINN